ncbi:MAG: 3'-5' exonuclease [Bacteroidota bacterium]
MIKQITLEDILFLDIETVPQNADFNELDNKTQKLWDKKSTHFRLENQSAEDVYGRAGIYAEFGKIICISAGILYLQDGNQKLRIKSFASENEKELLIEFKALVQKLELEKKNKFCAHNGKEFDFPYIARRWLINGIPLPLSFDVAGKKPWEVPFIDTMELWRFGDYKNYTSLDLLTHIFGIPTPKIDMDGSMVADVFWKEKNLARIVTYCQNDVIAIVQLMKKYRCEELIREEDIVVVEEEGNE